ncbi:MAG: hypothetical protein DCC67_07040 [Planctomycetota bacterium]|nr:MAG: hypothetical protein DCC67_07040 [Planctomycetota bacterium]
MRTVFAFAVVALAASAPCLAESPRALSRDALRDKIRGAWAAQMIGVSYGAATEFTALGQIIDGPIVPAPLANAIDQDDLYVEMTFAEVLDRRGLDATTADFGDAFKNTKYRLWHANAAARRNLHRGVPAVMCGHPAYNVHADDIDFQIEADFIGMMCPGLPRASNEYCQRVGRLMNYGDGLYGGMFIAGMYSAAFFEDDPRRAVDAGRACIPAGSPYGQILGDVLAWSAAEPDDWRSVWRRIEAKWNRGDACPEGVERSFNIDAKLNGAYVALGLLYGGGDWQKTMDVAARCGQDSDCNPASALGVLGAIRGFEQLPAPWRDEVARIADVPFSHTRYSFNGIVASTERRACEVIGRAGGRVSDAQVEVPPQTAQPATLELAEFGAPAAVHHAGDEAWQWRGQWADVHNGSELVARASDRPGDEATLTFDGTGVALVGELGAEGGRADVYIDGVKAKLAADAYVPPETFDEDLWRIFDLPPGQHALRLAIRDDHDSDSRGRRLVIKRAVAYRKAESGEQKAESEER